MGKFMTNKHSNHYYVPHHSHWPVVMSLGLFFAAIGSVNWIHGNSFGPYLLLFGAAIILYTTYRWFADVIHESHAGYYSAQVDRTFRIGMLWFIFSEVFFFGAFFGALFYARFIVLPGLGGDSLFHSPFTNTLLWADFEAVWPLLITPSPEAFTTINAVIGPWGIPALNTAILLTSGATITWAHWAIVKEHRGQFIISLLLTVVLGWIFLAFQAFEYWEGYTHLELKLTSGIYGTTFYMLTGFHGLHVFLGTVMILIILLRAMKGHFSSKQHFGFEATAWYWHFVDVVWLFLFVFVYWL